MDYLQKIIVDFEIQSLAGIRDCFENGIDPNQDHNGKPLFYELVNMYTRGPLFRECVRIFVDYGLAFEDKPLLAVLLNDTDMLEDCLEKDPASVQHTYSLDCAFTPIFEASLLHICAEYNHLESAELLVKHGASIQAKAGIDEYGFGGHTPVFHTVNQHANGSVDVLDFLLGLGVDLEITVTGLIWGKGYEWETFIPSVNPVSYAMMGLLPQFQRTEKDIYSVVTKLVKARYGLAYKPGNIPNKYLST